MFFCHRSGLFLFGKDDGSGFGYIIKTVRNHELGCGDEKEFKELLQPLYGEIVEMPSRHGPLFRTFTKDEAEYGICPKDDEGKVERDTDGKVKIYHFIKVFCLCYKKDKITGQHYLNGWYPDNWYYRFYGYNYHTLSDLTEPLQL